MISLALKMLSMFVMKNKFEYFVTCPMKNVYVYSEVIN